MAVEVPVRCCRGCGWLYRGRTGWKRGPVLALTIVKDVLLFALQQSVSSAPRGDDIAGHFVKLSLDPISSRLHDAVTCGW